ncbi:long-chain fatty alcohol dehydrogenase [Hypomontagnella submonticulosa]|nr:long-chain fatty alcohol dehydrogenase [Hypomontagnella submonticulosa]
MAAHHLPAPIPTPLPEPQPETYFSETQWQVLLALIDATVPSIVAEAEVTDRKGQLWISQSRYAEAYEQTKRSMKYPPNYEKFQQYLGSRLIDSPRFIGLLRRFVQGIPNSSRKQLGAVLNVIATRPGSLVATGYYTPLHEQPVHIREGIIQAWGKAWLSVWPIIGKSVTKMARALFAQTDPILAEISGFKGYDDNYQPGPSFDFNFMQFDAGSEVETVETDVVIVGSGCGGAVCAKVLSEAGHRVIVVDKGYYFPPSQLPMTAEAAGQFLYEGNASMQSASGTLTILAGSCWGGGGTVNWSVSLQPQGYVRQEWAGQGLDFFTTQEFQNCIDRVCDFMGVGDTYMRHNHGANVILNGAKKLGWAAKACPQNTGGAEHYCGHCAMGCGAGEKRGPTVSWLPAASQAGARFIEGFNVSKVLFDESHRSKRAIGITGTWTSRDLNGNVHTPESERIQRQLQIKAKKVIISCGTLQSPMLLMRSGLKNPHIGKNLHMHPACQLNASFDEDIKGWEGAILTSVCSSFEDLDGKGHGVKLEPTSMIPHMFLYEHPWKNALQWKLDALRSRQMNSFIAIARDRDTGRVYPDPDDGRPVVDYNPSAFDRKHLLAGFIALAKLCYIEGATEIWPFIQSLPSFVRRPKPAGPTLDKGAEGDDIDQGINDPDFVAWLKLLERTGVNFPDTSFGSAHQMGSCRMSTHPARGVVNPKGKVWEAQDLYVADASVFPSASGVNPMITNMAIADWIARGVSQDLKKGSQLRASL